jgi:hypothetical protein
MVLSDRGMKMKRKAQGLSLNTIIVAIIVLIVLVVIIMLFTGYFGSKFTPGVTSCTAQGGNCVDRGSCSTAFGDPGRTIERTSDCNPEGIPESAQVCCISGVQGGASPFGTDNSPDTTPDGTGGEESGLEGLLGSGTAEDLS